MAILKNTTISDTGFLRLPVGTTAQRPESPDNGMIRYNVNNSVLEYWNGSSWVDLTDTSNFVPAFTKYTYTINSNITSISGADDNSNTLSYSTTDKNVEVFVNGIKLVEGASNDYTATTGTSVSFTYTIPSGSVIDIQVYELLSAAELSQWTTSGSNIYYNTGNVGIGDTPTVSLDVGGRTDAIRIPVGTTAQRPASPTNGMIRYNTDLGGVEYYSVNRSQWVGVELFQATGGTTSVYTDGGITYKVHTFTTSGTFTVVTGTKQIEYLIVAGGGGGAADVGGAGGAGGLRYGTNFSITTGSYTIVVGGGGVGRGSIGGSGDTAPGGSGGNSSAFNIISIGGGGGGCYGTGNATSGGSGGGAGGGSGSTSVGSGTSGQGNSGGQGNPGSSPYASGGGGGAGAVGGNYTATGGGNGGNGLQYSINGTPTYYAGGGGGGGGNDSGSDGRGFGGLGGGGVGAARSGTYKDVGDARNGSSNSGGGGGGTGGWNLAGSGGSGIVIIRYAI